MMELSRTELSPRERALLRTLLQGHGMRQVACTRGESAVQTAAEVRRVLRRLSTNARPARPTAAATSRPI